MTIYIATDHAGFELKEQLVPYLEELGHDVVDMGASSLADGDDYPDYILPCAKKVAENEENFGIILGGSGQGEAMAANKVPGIRASVFYGEAYPWLGDEEEGRGDGFQIVALAREHNNANILSLGARFISYPVAQEAVRVFLTTAFSEEARHIRRLEKF